MKKKVLIIEDDVQLNIVLCEFFKISGYEVISVYDGIKAIDVIDTLRIDNINLYVIDINLPSYSGIDVLKYIRESNTTIPVIVITASLEIENFTNAFEAGCSEYIKKPFHIKELEVRVNNLLQNNTNKIVFSKDFYYYYEDQNFYYKEEKIYLRKKEKKLISILIQNINKLVPLEIIYEYVWDYETKESYPIRQLLADLRKKLPIDIIKTVIKQGYIIERPHEK